MFICVLRGRKVYGGIATTLALVAGCGGGSDYANKPRPPAPINVTAAISNSKISVSPQRFGAGPIVLIISNQSSSAQAVTFETDELGGTQGGNRASSSEIAPGSTGRLTITTREGTYSVHTQDDAIRAVEVKIGPPRPSGQDKLLLP